MLINFIGFYINLPPGGLVILIFFALTIPEQMDKKPVRTNLKAIITQELDLIGFALFAPACIMFLLAMIWGGTTYRWNSSTIIGLFCGAFATLVVFIIWILYRGEKAMIPPKIARKRLIIFGCGTSFFQMGSLLLLSYYLPVWFQVVKDASPTMSGVMILPTAIAQIFSAVVAGKFGNIPLRDIYSMFLTFYS
jgi:Fungal trichothecene efflux pump (TRI12).